jgi:pimeloyl-ACP methyl ester carboxylesterase
VGWSDPGPFPRTSKAIATDLHALLSAAGIPPPYVLVGYSFGGHNVRVYNGLYPNEVAGMVLVDAASEEEYQRIGPWGRGKRVANWLRYPLYLATKLLVETGVVRLTTAGGEPVPIPGWTPLQNGILATLHKRPEAVAAGMSTALFADENDRQAHDAGGLGDKPLIVLTAGKMLEMPREIATEAAAYHQIFVHELQPKLARLSARGRQVIVPDATHELGSTKPGVVVDAVREVVETVRREHR